MTMVNFAQEMVHGQPLEYLPGNRFQRAPWETGLMNDLNTGVGNGPRFMLFRASSDSSASYPENYMPTTGLKAIHPFEDPTDVYAQPWIEYTEGVDKTTIAMLTDEDSKLENDNGDGLYLFTHGQPNGDRYVLRPQTDAGSGIGTLTTSLSGAAETAVVANIGSVAADFPTEGYVYVKTDMNGAYRRLHYSSIVLGGGTAITFNLSAPEDFTVYPASAGNGLRSYGTWRRAQYMRVNNAAGVTTLTFFLNTTFGGAFSNDTFRTHMNLGFHVNTTGATDALGVQSNHASIFINGVLEDEKPLPAAEPVLPVGATGFLMAASTFIAGSSDGAPSDVSMAGVADNVNDRILAPNSIGLNQKLSHWYGAGHGQKLNVLGPSVWRS